MKATCFQKLTVVLGVTALVILPGGAKAQTTSVKLEHAKGEKLATAVGHFARARSLLIAAVNEFDKGNKMVNPSALINTTEWRNSLIDRAEDLERVLDPQPRANRTGVAFSPDRRLIGNFSEAPSE
jgi:hypothetical protein